MLTGGPDLAAVGPGGRHSIPAGGARHQVAVTAPCPELSPERDPMVFDVGAGLYWRPEDGGLLFGMSNPEELPGVGAFCRLGLPGAHARTPGLPLPGYAGPGTEARLGGNHRLHARPSAHNRSSGECRR